MKYKDFFNHIKNKEYQSIYLLHGEEEYTKQLALQQLEAFVQPEFEQINYQKLDGERLEPNTFIECCEALPLMDEHRLVVVRNYDLLNGPRGTANDTEKVIEYLKKVPDHLILVFYCTAKADARKKLYKAIGKNKKAGVYEFERLNENELIKWIHRECKKENVVISKADAALLVSYIGNDMLRIKSETEKLIACAGGKLEISRAMVNQLTEMEETETVFMLMDYIGKQNARGAYRLLRQLMNDGVESMNIIALIARHFRFLIKVRGTREKTIKGIPHWAVKKYIAQSKNFSTQQLRSGIKLCTEINNGMKNGTYVDSKAAVELLVMKICTNHMKSIS